MIFPASRRSLEEVSRYLRLMALDMPLEGSCLEEGVACLHSELLSLAQEVTNALVEDAQAVPYRTNVPEA